MENTAILACFPSYHQTIILRIARISELQLEAGMLFFLKIYFTKPSGNF